MTIFDELGHFLCHEFVDLCDARIENLLGDGFDVEVERWVFLCSEGLVRIPCAFRRDARTCFTVDLLLGLTFCEHVAVALIVDLDIVRELCIMRFALFALWFGGGG